MVKLIFKAYKIKNDKVFFYNFFSLYIKMLARYYKKKANKERLLKKARKRYKNFSEEEKDKRSQYSCE